MARHRYGTFSGGITLPAEKQATIDQPVQTPPTPALLRVPLGLGEGPAAEPVVSIGQCVRAGDRLASAAAGGIDVFAPVDATVGPIETVLIESGRSLFRAPAIRLEQPGDLPSLDRTPAEEDWTALDGGAIRDRLAESHLPRQHGRPGPLIDWVDRCRARPPQLLVLNGMEDQPYVTAEHRLLAEFGAEVVAGLVILGKACQAERLTIAVTMAHAEEYPELLSGTSEFDIERVALPPKYPIGADHLLLKVLTRREVPMGGSPGDIGAAVIDASTCLATYRWVACRQRLTGRVVTVSGDRAERQGNVYVPYGMGVVDLLPSAEPPYVLRGPMIGCVIDADAVIAPTTDAVLALDPTPQGRPSQCIRCGWCRDHCPARLNVAQLNDCYELAQLDRADLGGAMSCIGCGVCSYLCPARLNLAQRVGQLKRAILDIHRSAPLLAHAGSEGAS